MAATIAHEVNNPLEASRQPALPPPPQDRDSEGLGYLDAAESELARVAHIAKQTLGYYREHAAATCSSLSELAAHAVTIYQPRCSAAKIQIEKRLEPTTTIILRKGEIMQVISNLMTNSIYAMPAGGTLRITVKNTREPDPESAHHRRQWRRHP